MTDNQPSHPIQTYLNKQQTGSSPVSPDQLPSHDQLYEVGYQLALGKLGYKGMQSKIFADAFVGEYQRALENGLSDALAIRFGAEFAGPFAMAFMHYLSVNDKREEDHDIYGGARAFAQMSFDIYEEQFAQDFSPIHEEKMEAQNLQQMISKALKEEVTTENLGAALQAQYTKVYQTAHQDGYEKGHETGHEAGVKEGKTKGKEIGHEAGYHEGVEVGKIGGKKLGYEEGYAAGKSDALKDISAGDVNFNELNVEK